MHDLPVTAPHTTQPDAHGNNAKSQAVGNYETTAHFGKYPKTTFMCRKLMNNQVNISKQIFGCDCPSFLIKELI